MSTVPRMRKNQRQCLRVLIFIRNTETSRPGFVSEFPRHEALCHAVNSTTDTCRQNTKYVHPMTWYRYRCIGVRNLREPDYHDAHDIYRGAETRWSMLCKASLALLVRTRKSPGLAIIVITCDVYTRGPGQGLLLTFTRSIRGPAWAARVQHAENIQALVRVTVNFYSHWSVQWIHEFPHLDLNDLSQLAFMAHSVEVHISSPLVIHTQLWSDQEMWFYHRNLYTASGLPAAGVQPPKDLAWWSLRITPINLGQVCNHCYGYRFSDIYSSIQDSEISSLLHNKSYMHVGRLILHNMHHSITADGNFIHHKQ